MPELEKPLKEQILEIFADNAQTYTKIHREK
jgi:hypothetical protein